MEEEQRQKLAWAGWGEGSQTIGTTRELGSHRKSRYLGAGPGWDRRIGDEG